MPGFAANFLKAQQGERQQDDGGAGQEDEFDETPVWNPLPIVDAEVRWQVGGARDEGQTGGGEAGAGDLSARGGFRSGGIGPSETSNRVEMTPRACGCMGEWAGDASSRLLQPRPSSADVMPLSSCLLLLATSTVIRRASFKRAWRGAAFSRPPATCGQAQVSVGMQCSEAKDSVRTCHVVSVGAWVALIADASPPVGEGCCIGASRFVASMMPDVITWSEAVEPAAIVECSWFRV